MRRAGQTRRGQRPGSLHSLPVGKRAASYLSALLLAATLVLIAGCGTDRSSLLSSETAAGLEAELERVETLVAAGDCFAALDIADAALIEVEDLRGEIDDRLRNSLVDGLTELQIVIQDECRAETTEGVVIEEEPAPTDTGGAEPEQDRGDGGQRPEPEPEPNPTPTPTPTPTPPDSGGVSPGGTTPTPGGGSG
jgi:hypothetical protein